MSDYADRTPAQELAAVTDAERAWAVFPLIRLRPEQVGRAVTALSLVLMLGLYVPPYLADWYRAAARLIGGE